jgi:glycerol-3-phosphate dehydrogenase
MIWNRAGRAQSWTRLQAPWDVIVVGGGITGAGILDEASTLGFRTLLVEQQDFASGTSSRSSKLVHGGLRYLKQGQIALAGVSVRERERLLKEAPGLVERLGFLASSRPENGAWRHLFGAGLALYDLMGGRWAHHHYSASDFRWMAPHVSRRGLEGGFEYADAVTDDARLVLRLILGGVARGATALSYTCVESLLRARGRVVGVALRDGLTGRRAEVRASVVINATGAWTDRLRSHLGKAPRVRPLRGSHLVFPAWRFPLPQAALFYHPRDRRPLFAVPWEGAVLVGTTDLDHEQSPEQARISESEVSYLMEALGAEFPALALEAGDAGTSFSGVRPVIGTGRVNPSAETREHVLWDEAGLLTVAGGKLTTFRPTARAALRAVRRRLPTPQPRTPASASADPARDSAGDLLRGDVRRRLVGRYGPEAAHWFASCRTDELERIPGTHTLWAELRWAALAEGVAHLDDLLLRRTRLGLLLPQGGLRFESRIRALCQPELGWDDARWQRERQRYSALWQTSHALPHVAATPCQSSVQDATGASPNDGQPAMGAVLR